jgi:hypothetical protein
LQNKDQVCIGKWSDLVIYHIPNFSSVREKWSWTAALTDGEGDLEITVGIQPNNKIQIETDASISNSNLLLLEAFLNTVKLGILYPFDLDEDHIPKPTKPAWIIRIAKRAELIELLENCIEFLIVKREKARAILQFLRSREYRIVLNKNRPNTPYTIEEIKPLLPFLTEQSKCRLQEHFKILSQNLEEIQT